MTEFIDLQTQKRSQSIGDVFSKIGQLNSSPARGSAAVCMPGCRMREAGQMYFTCSSLLMYVPISE